MPILFTMCSSIISILNYISYDTEASILYLEWFITNGIVSSTFYDKQHDFNFGIDTFPFLGLALLWCLCVFPSLFVL